MSASKTAVTDPFSTGAPPDEPVDEPTDDLGMIAAGSLANGEHQDALEGTNFTKVRFTGMGYNALEADLKIGDELTFLVTARCVGIGDEAVRKDEDQIRHVAKMDVQSVDLHKK